MNLIALTITLALTATTADVEAAHDAIDNIFGGKGIAPEAAVSVSVPTIDGTITLPTSTVELDSSGMPWDARIHAETKAKIANGTWRARRNLDKSLVSKVEAEIRATIGTPTPANATVAALPTPAPLPLPLPTLAPLVLAAPENPAFTAFVAFVVENSVPKGAITADWLKASLTNFGVAEGELQNVAHKPELIPVLEGAFRTALGL